jgi:hypothetical protein
MSKRLAKIVRLMVVGLFTVGTLPASADRIAAYAGTVSSVDRARGSFVLQDVGPWRGGTPDANITNRTIVVTPSTKFAMARRTADGTNKFPGDYEEVSAQPSVLKEGSFVSVECQSTGEQCQALKLTVVQTDHQAS